MEQPGVFIADHRTDGVDGVGVAVPLTVQMDREDWLAQPLPPWGFVFKGISH